MVWQVMYGAQLVAQFDVLEHAQGLVSYDNRDVLGLEIMRADENFERSVYTYPLNTVEKYWLLKIKTGREL